MVLGPPNHQFWDFARVTEFHQTVGSLNGPTKVKDFEVDNMMKNLNVQHKCLEKPFNSKKWWYDFFAWIFMESKGTSPKKSGPNKALVRETNGF